jgi:glycosyltransferase involved in cell wall biosynthesis
MANKKSDLKFAIFIIAYNAAETIVKVFERIPNNIKESAEEIFVIDDCSQDDTFEIIAKYKEGNGLYKLNVYKNTTNLGYGGNQKAGYKYAIEKGYDLVAMLHADAQYAPEYIEDLIRMFENNSGNSYGMIFGSRMSGKPLKGNMPLYKYVSNKFLTTFENFILGSNLSEFHSGFRCYSCKALSEIPFELCSDGFSFDTEIIIMLLQNNNKIGEIPIPTHYGSEKCHVPLVRYGLGCLKAVMEYKLSQLGIAVYERYSTYNHSQKQKIYDIKFSPFSSHSKINDLIDKYLKNNNKNIRKYDLLDLACGSGPITYSKEYDVNLVGIDKFPTVNSEYYSKVHKAEITNFDLIKRLNLGKYDIIVMADVLEHFSNPKKIVSFYGKFLKSNGRIIISVPNIANIYIRLSLLFGNFNYSNRGILDRTHLRFFTLRSINGFIRMLGYETKEVTYTPLPLELVLPGLINIKGAKTILSLLDKFTGFRKELFAYQHILVIGKKDE